MSTMSATATGSCRSELAPALSRELAQLEAELGSYRAALNRHAIVGTTDRKGTITDVNDKFCEISGFDRSELIGAKHSIVNSRHHPRSFFAQMWRTIARGEAWHGEICNRSKNGKLYWVDTTIVPRKDESGAINGYVSIRYDITQRKQAEASLIEQNSKREQVEMLLRDLIEAMPNGIAAFDYDDRLFLFNSALKECYPDVEPALVEGATFEGILRCALERGQFANVPQDHAAREAWVAARVRQHRSPGRGAVLQLNGDRWIHVLERRSRSGFIVGVRTDISELKRAERQIKLQAETDPLTGLSNRRVMLARLEHAVFSRRQAERCGALVLADLDEFKAINDTFGHDVGDRLLIEIARRFRQTVRKTDLVARLGGDEFALILWGQDEEASAARVVRRLLRSLEVPVEMEGRSIPVAGSFGIAMFPTHGQTLQDLLKHADMALYQAKRDGRSRLVIYNADMRKSAERKRSMVDALRAALDRDEIRVALQPQIRFANGRHSGFEALVRWRCGQEDIPPPELISLAEESGQIDAVGRRILQTAFANFQGIKSHFVDAGTLSVNVSAAQLKQGRFARTFLEMMRERGMAPCEVVVEITENVVLDASSFAIGETLLQLHRAGVGIALDDFGTGYASLSHLKRFPIDYLKIDRSFVREIAADEDGVIARTIISLAHSLEMEVVAEGVETDGQFRALSNMGCDYAQGFLIGYPMFEQDIEGYARRMTSQEPTLLAKKAHSAS